MRVWAFVVMVLATATGVAGQTAGLIQELKQVALSGRRAAHIVLVPSLVTFATPHENGIIRLFVSRREVLERIEHELRAAGYEMRMSASLSDGNRFIALDHKFDEIHAAAAARRDGERKEVTFVTGLGLVAALIGPFARALSSVPRPIAARAFLVLVAVLFVYVLFLA